MSNEVEPKWIGKSKTIWGVALMAIPAIATLMGFEWTTEQGTELDAIFGLILEGIGMILAVYGRYSADGPVTLKP